jgi:hypothetical protein
MHVQDLFNAANIAGAAAATTCAVAPMVVTWNGGANREVVEDGVCGFAWVNIKPAVGPFVKYLKANKIGHKSYHGGWDIWISDYGQSMTRKEAHADAMAEYLRAHGLKAYAQSRMD